MSFVPRYASHFGEVAGQGRSVRWTTSLLLALAAFSASSPQALASPASTTTTLALISGGSPAATIVAGNVVTMTAAATSGGTPLTVGQVNFCDAAAPYCTDIHLLGTAQLTSAGTAVIRFVPGAGVHSYKAVFLGTTAQSPSSSAPSPLTVTGITDYLSTAVLTSSGVPGNYTLTAVVTGGGGATVSPTGTVSFLDTTNANYVLGTGPLAPTVDQLTFVNSSNPATGSGPKAIAAGDFNGDGLLDIVAANQADATLTVLLGNGDGTFRLSQTVPLSSVFYPQSIVVADINDDGKPDLLVGSYPPNGAMTNGALDVLLGNGDGTFVALPLLQVSEAPFFLATGDFNSDGKADIVFANAPSSQLNFLFGNGDGTFTTGPQIVAGVSAAGIAVADFNGDGKPDLAVGNSDFEVKSDFVTILLANGDGTFTPAPSLPVPQSPLSVVAADFNGDGKADLATVNFLLPTGVNNRSVSILLGHGDGTFAPAVNLPVTYDYPDAIALGDFNGDGKPDLAITYLNDYTGTVTIFLGNGDGTFSAAKNITTNGGTGAVATGDFNDDGRSDFAEADRTGDVVGVFLAEATSATATLTSVSPVGMGQHLVDASYPGDINFGSSLSNVVSLTAEPVPTTLTLTAIPAQGFYQQSFILTAAVTPNTAQNHNAGGTVTFYNGTNALATINLSGSVATLNVSTPLPVGTYSLSAVYSGDINFTPSTGTLQYGVAATTPGITFTIPNHTYGDPPFPVSATSNSTGAITYSVVSGPATLSGSTVTLTGAGAVVLQASVAATGNFAAATQNATFTVTKESQTVSFAQPSSPIVYGTTPAALSASASSGLAVAFSVLSGPATVTGSTLTPTGIGTVVVAADQPGNANFAAATEVTRTTVIVKGSPAMTLNATPDPVLLQNPVTLTATLSSATSSPTGSVMFFDGATPLGSATLNSGIVALTLSTLTLGSHSITAAYSGDATFLAATLPSVVTENVQDFSLDPSGDAAQTIPYGGTATYSFNIASIGGPSIPSALSLKVLGAPPGSAITITPQILPTGTTTANVVLAIHTASEAASNNTSHRSAASLAIITFGALLLPFRRRRILRTKFIGHLDCAILLLALAGTTAALSGCGNTVLPRIQNFTITVTATSGALSHSANATLVEQ